MLFQITNSDVYALAVRCRALVDSFKDERRAYPPDRADFETLIREWVKNLEFPTQLLNKENL